MKTNPYSVSASSIAVSAIKPAVRGRQSAWHFCMFAGLLALGLAGSAQASPAQPLTSSSVSCAVVAAAHDITVVLDATGRASVTAAQVDNGSTAACGLASMAVTPSTFTCANRGANPVSLTVTDVNGNVSTATAIVTVRDTQAPAIVVPVAITISADPGQCTANRLSLGMATATDNCTVASIGNNAPKGSGKIPAIFTVGTTVVTWTATDNTGNMAQATQVVTIVDTERPTITAPAAVTVSADQGQCSASNVVLGTPTAGDNCVGATVTNNAPTVFPVGTTTVTWTATDASGNQATASQTVTVTDQVAPTLSIQNLVINAPATQCGAVVNFGTLATDNCAGVSVVTSVATGSTFPIGTSTVSVTATDASGNASTGSFTVTVNDVTAPTMQAQNVTVTLVNGTASLTAAQVDNGSSDACGIASLVLSQTSFTTADEGSVTVTLTATDVHGNVSSAPAVLTVIGDMPEPVITVALAPGDATGLPANTLCLGYGAQSATLHASGGTTYTWSPAAGLSNPNSAQPVFTPTAAGTYTFIVRASNGSSSATKSVTLQVTDARCGNRNDKVVVCHNGHEICISVNAVAAHLAHPGDVIGGCSTSARQAALTAGSATPEAEGATATEVTADYQKMEIYPNPTADQATISFRTPLDGPATVEVYNQMGYLVKTIYKGAVTSGQQYTLPLSTQGLTAGLYECRLVLKGKSERLRLVVAR